MKNIGKNSGMISAMVLFDWIVLVILDLIYLKTSLDIDCYYHLLTIVIAFLDFFFLRHYIYTRNAMLNIFCIFVILPFNFMVSILAAYFSPISWGFETIEFFYIISNAQVIFIALIIIDWIWSNIKKKE